MSELRNDEILTPRQVAQAIGLSEASLKRWCDKGLLPCTKTVGGHRRLPLSGVIDFLRKSGYPLVHPEALGLPSNTGRGETVLDRAASHMRESLEAGNEQAVRRIITDIFLARYSFAFIGDLVISPAFSEIGHRWSCGEVQIYRERRAVEICLRALATVRAAIVQPQPDAPLALGGSVFEDPYRLANSLVELSLLESGWNTQLLGNGLPVEELEAAMREQRPRLVWLSVSWLPDGRDIPAICERLLQTAQLIGARFVCGGRAIDENIRPSIPALAYCPDLRTLQQKAAEVWSPPLVS